MIVIIDYNAGNLTSVERAVRHLGYRAKITNNLEELQDAERIIFPGVGAAGAAMDNLRQKKVDTILTKAFSEKKPILGICLGTQIVFTYSEENNVICLDLLPGMVTKFPYLTDGSGRPLKIPHMGWNKVTFSRSHFVFDGLDPDSEFYFVHSYYPEVEKGQEDIIIGKTHYGLDFASAVAKDNLVAVQFHPEKSGRAGLSILDNFCRWNP